MSDEGTPRYAAGFRQAVRRLLGPKENGWSSALYTDEEAIAQALRKAYWEGRFDAIDALMGHPAAPGPVEVEEDATETREEAWERLGLFPAPAEPPALATVTLEPLGDADPYTWAVRQSRTTLGLSLVEATDFVTGVLDD